MHLHLQHGRRDPGGGEQVPQERHAVVAHADAADEPLVDQPLHRLPGVAQRQIGRAHV